MLNVLYRGVPTTRLEHASTRGTHPGALRGASRVRACERGLNDGAVLPRRRANAVVHPAWGGQSSPRCRRPACRGPRHRGWPTVPPDRPLTAGRLDLGTAACTSPFVRHVGGDDRWANRRAPERSAGRRDGKAVGVSSFLHARLRPARHRRRTTDACPPGS
jgi:hypothetical protein